MLVEGFRNQKNIISVARFIIVIFPWPIPPDFGIYGMGQAVKDAGKIE